MIKFTVMGTTPFPKDMLRYDHCYPSCIDAVNEIEASEYPGEIRRVKLRGELAPTLGRWKSFGWTIIEIEDTRRTKK